MAGKKGRSGRRTKYEEVHINELAGMSVRWAIDHWSKLSTQDRMKILTAIGPKYVVQKFDGQIGKDTQIVIVTSSGERIGSHPEAVSRTLSV